MNRISKVSVLVLLVAVFAAGAICVNLIQPVSAQPGGAARGHHTVVMTDGTHLVVTDDKTDTLYFYSIEKDAEIGSDLKLRGKVDLGQVGKTVISPVVMFKKKSD